MIKYSFGKHDIQIGPLGIGALNVQEDPEHAAMLTNRLLDAGCNFIDTAACYPGHEAFLAKYIMHRRDEFILSTKCGHHEVLPDGTMRSLKITMADIDAALTRLNTQHLDIMMLHSYDMEPLKQGDALSVLEAAKKAGKIRWAGYSGDNERAKFAAGHETIDIIMCSISISDQANLQSVMPQCIKRGLGVIAKKPIANAMWRFFGRANEAHFAARDYVSRLEAMNLNPGDYGCNDMAELAIRFTIGIPGVSCAIASSSKIENQDANIKAVEKGPLTQREITQIIEIFGIAETSDTNSPWPALN